MKLPHEFYRLPLRFDADRLREEVESLPPDAWSGHPTGYEGNSAVRLISAEGGDNDSVTGPMRATPWLQRLPYVQQVLQSFGVVWSRSRLMRLDPGARVPPHCDVSYHWRHRMRIHIPITTSPEVLFHCGDKTVHMAPGSAWTFDNWRPHRVENGSHDTRVHLVADTVGNAQMLAWLAQSSLDVLERRDPASEHFVPWRTSFETPFIATEQHNRSTVMHPAELDALVAGMIGDFGSEHDTPQARTAFAQWRRILREFCAEWRQLWALYGETMPGWPHYARVRDEVRQALQQIAVPVYMWSNQVLASQAVEAGILLHVLNPPGAEEVESGEYAVGPGAAGLAHDATPTPPSAPAAAPANRATGRGQAPLSPPPGLRRMQLDRPLFIVAAPRSGSTLLFETLAASTQLWTVGGEAHGLIEQFPSLCPGADGLDSNRLTGERLTQEIAQRIGLSLASALRNAAGERPTGDAILRLLEKTPKNALRVPFFKTLFPNARFIHLWRDPRPSIASIMEAWDSGGWITYDELPGWRGPWSLLLPPGWQALAGRPLEEVAAFQWQRTHDIALDDLAALPAQDWTHLSYDAFVADPEAETRRLCAFAELDFDAGLQQRVAAALPLSRHTQTAPDADKWRRHEEAITRILPQVTPTWERLQAL